MEGLVSLSSCRNASDVAYYVRKKVELCIQNYMSLEVTAKYLEKNHEISKTLTHLVWEQLRKENPVFFVHLDLRRQMSQQMRMYNDMLTKQAVLMSETGLLHISDVSPSVRTLLRGQHPERVHLLETLASKRKLRSASFTRPYANGKALQTFVMPNPYDQQDQVFNPESFAMPNPNGSLAAQWQIPNEQLNQHLYPLSLALSNANGHSMTQQPIPYDQQEIILYTTSLPLPTANGPSMTQLPGPYNQQNQPHQNPLPTYNDHIAPTFAPAYTDDWSLFDDPAFADLGALPLTPPADTNQWPTPDDLAYTATFELGGDIGHNGPSFMDADTLIAVTHLNEQQPHWQQQQNVQVEGSNGDIIDELLCDNFDITYTSLHEQQAGGVEGHHPESEALNNQDSGNNHNGPSFLEPTTPLVVVQPDEQMQHQNGHYQQHLQVQQNVQVVTIQPGGRNNGMVNGEQLCSNFDKHQCVDLQQAGGVKRHYPESEALNNPDNGVTGHNGPTDSYIKSAAQLVTQPSEHPQQQNVPVETLQREGSNDHELCNNFDRTQSKRMCTGVDQQQGGRVKRHHPESEALYNPNSGNGIQTEAATISKDKVPERVGAI